MGSNDPVLESKVNNWMRNSGTFRFIENKGQMTDLQGGYSPVENRADKCVADMNLLFKASGNGTDMYVTTWGLSYVFTKTEKAIIPQLSGSKNIPVHGIHSENESVSVQYCRADMELVGADIRKENVIKEGESEDHTDYYLPQCPDGLMNVHSYERITIKNIYPGIDWVLYLDDALRASDQGMGGQDSVLKSEDLGFRQCEAFMNSNKDKRKDVSNKNLKSVGGFKYDFVVHPGADPSQIRLRYKWTDKPGLQKNGSLKISTPMGDIEEGIPVSYGHDKDHLINTHYTLKDDEIRFTLDKYAKDDTLIIDPSLTWASYYAGGAGDGDIFSISTDGANVWLTGVSDGMGFPTHNAGGSAYFQGSFVGSSDLIILEFSTCGQLIWATYYGGSGYDLSTSICSDGKNVWVTGYTNSGNFKTRTLAGAYNKTVIPGIESMFILEFNCTTNALIWATYYGGSGTDIGNSISSDGVNVWVTGEAFSTNFPTFPLAGGYNQSGLGGAFATNAFVLKFNASTSARVWATYYGGSKSDFGWAINSDGVNVWLTGQTSSTDFPVMAAGGAYNKASLGGTGATNIFVSKFNCATGVLVWATYFGGSGVDRGNSISSDGVNVWVTGQAKSSDFPTQPFPLAYNQSLQGGVGTTSAFILQFSCINSALIWATLYGGSGSGTNGDIGYSIQSDKTNVWVCGATSSSDFPTMSSTCGYYKGTISGSPVNTSVDVFILQFSTAGVRRWATYYGADSESDGSYVCSDGMNVFVSGDAEGSTYPILDPGGTAYFNNTLVPGKENTFIAKFIIPCLMASQDTGICPGGSAQLNASGRSGYNWSPSANLSSPTIANPVASPTITTTYTVTGADACGSTTTATVTVTLNPAPEVSITPGSPTITCNSPDITLTGSSTATGAIYQWTGGPANPTYTVSAASTYTLLVTDANSCTATSTVTVVGSTPANVSVLTVKNTCTGNTDGAITLSALGAGLTYTWSGGLSGSTLVSGLAAGSYTVTVRDGSGCTATTTANISLFPDPVVGVGTNETIAQGESILLTASGGIRYLWNPSSSLNNDTLYNPTAIPDQTTSYKVSVTDVNGCTAIDSVLITVVSCEASKIFVPTAFSPNGDGQNDVLYVRGALCAIQLHFQLFDRWGEVVFETTNPATGWDGTFKGKTMETGVFAYYLTAILSNGQSVSKRGNITLIR